MHRLASIAASLILLGFAAPASAAYTCVDAVRELESKHRQLDGSMRENLARAKERLRRGDERECRHYADAVFEELQRHEKQSARERDSDRRYDDRRSDDRRYDDRRSSEGSSQGGLGDLIEKGLGAIDRR